jgi:hypothetical protein
MGLTTVWADAWEVGLPLSAMFTTTASPTAQTAATASTAMRTGFMVAALLARRIAATA